MEESKVQHPKVVVIGAGSLFFGRQSIWQMVHSQYLNTGTLALVDTNKDVLTKMVKLAKMVVKEAGVSLKVEGSTDRRDVLSDADFVVLSFAEKSVYYRGIDCTISEKYGIRMCSGDTIGPGGIFRAMRELPVIIECAKDIERLCPKAWVINYINPTTVHGLALKKYFPQLKSFALCDAQHMPHIKKNYAKRAGLINQVCDYTQEIDDGFNFKIAGVNHFTWLLKAEFEGKDMCPEIAESVRRDAITETDGGDTGSKSLNNDLVGYELYKAFGYLPTVVGHTKEYVRFWQGKNIAPEAISPLSIWDPEERYPRHISMFEQVDRFISGETPIGEYMTSIGADHATDVIENMVGNLGKKFFINTYNKGAVTNMRDDVFLELLCEATLEGIHPLPVGDMPLGIRGMQELVHDTHELTADAVYQGSYELLRRAMLTDPLVTSIADADAIIKELLAIEKDQIPSKWYK